MCKDCFDEQYYDFPSQTEFEKFEKILDIKCNSEKIKILESNSVMDFRMYYKCNTCNEKFVMSIPDNAWRGYFLTMDNAIKYHEKIIASDKKKKNGFFAFIVLIVIYIIYSIIK